MDKYYLPPEVMDIIVSNLDYYSIAQFSATCKRHSTYHTIPKRQMRRREVLRCARIYKILTDLGEDALEEFDGALEWEGGTSDFHESMKNSFGPTTTQAILSTLLDVYEMKPPVEYFRFIDQELYDIIQDDMRMMAPPDLGLIWCFYKQAYLKV